MFIYIPIIDKEIKAFVADWNAHRIRKDRRRPNHVAGRPCVLYESPPDGIQDYLEPIDYETVDELKNFLDYFGKLARDLHAPYLHAPYLHTANLHAQHPKKSTQLKLKLGALHHYLQQGFQIHEIFSQANLMLKGFGSTCSAISISERLLEATSKAVSSRPCSCTRV